MKYLGDMLIKVGQMEQVIYKVMENHFYFPLLKIVNIYVSKINIQWTRKFKKNQIHSKCAKLL